MQWELSGQAWVRLQEMKRVGADAGKAYRQLEKAMNELPDVPVILRRGKLFAIPFGQWRAMVRERGDVLIVLDIEPRFRF